MTGICTVYKVGLKYKWQFVFSTCNTTFENNMEKKVFSMFKISHFPQHFEKILVHALSYRVVFKRVHICNSFMLIFLIMKNRPVIESYQRKQLGSNSDYSHWQSELLLHCLSERFELLNCIWYDPPPSALSIDPDQPKHAEQANPDGQFSPPVDFLFQESLLYISTSLKRNVSARISLRRLI